ncbi:hypothetical protein B0H10DRAFT_2320039 [Mycena sp. CBHHK59/15]|nr:hypothetical protein B0H10DRAFT_2320039 [Mycena sp. CBHHK59/15]
MMRAMAGRLQVARTSGAVTPKDGAAGFVTIVQGRAQPIVILVVQVPVGSIPQAQFHSTFSNFVRVSGWQRGRGNRSAESWKASPAIAVERICRPARTHALLAKDPIGDQFVSPAVVALDYREWIISICGEKYSNIPSGCSLASPPSFGSLCASTVTARVSTYAQIDPESVIAGFRVILQHRRQSHKIRTTVLKEFPWGGTMTARRIKSCRITQDNVKMNRKPHVKRAGSYRSLVPKGQRTRIVDWRYDNPQKK